MAKATRRKTRAALALALLRNTLVTSFLVFAVWNPSGHSWFAWVSAADDVTAGMGLTGIALLVVLIAIGRIATVALGWIGAAAVTLAVALVLATGDKLALWQAGVIVSHATFWLALLGLTLGVGVTWALVQQRLSGERAVLKDPP